MPSSESLLDFLTAIGLAVTGVIHLLPVIGLRSGRQLEKLYGVSLGDSDLVLMMRHRALLFGLLGALCLAAIVRSELVPVALIGGWVSVVGFLVLARSGSSRRHEIQRVVMADWIAAVALAAASVSWLINGDL